MAPAIDEDVVIGRCDVPRASDGVIVRADDHARFLQDLITNDSHCRFDSENWMLTITGTNREVVYDLYEFDLTTRTYTGRKVIDTPLSNLTFDVFARTNRRRCERWHPGFPADDWTIADWSNATSGEVGELVEAVLAIVASSGKLANVAKKIRRQEAGRRGAVDPDTATLVEQAGDEIGDVLAYLDLTAQRLGLDLGTVAARKFNKISEREGFPERLPVPE